MLSKILIIALFITLSIYLLKKVECAHQAPLHQSVKYEPREERTYEPTIYDEDCQTSNGDNCIWNNTVSSSGCTVYADENTKNTPRIFKYPNYYGYGSPSPFHYGEPFYERTTQ